MYPSDPESIIEPRPADAQQLREVNHARAVKQFNPAPPRSD